MSPIKDFENDALESVLVPTYGSRALQAQVAKFKIPQTEMSPRAAYDIISDELMLDGNSRLNLATFVTTWMEPEARQIMADTFEKNMIDKDEYPQTAEIEKRCVNIIADLWNAPDLNEIIGCSTTGSSEACMLAGLAMKWKWRQQRQLAGKDTTKPNLIMGVNVHICWKKFCLYWDVEIRQVPMEDGRYCLNGELAASLCDENTIGVVSVLGSTFTGEYEPVKEIHDAVVAVNKKNNWDIAIHVDAASGGFIAPFVQSQLEWDFRLPLVRSINVSGHKYGLVYPGVGWIIWKTKADLPEELIFNVNYLGGSMPTFALNFSRPANQIIGQYYNFLRLGFDGYKRIQQSCIDVASYLAAEVEKLGPFRLLSGGTDLPVFCWTLKEPMNFNLYDLSDRLRMNGWQVPAYSLPKSLTDVVVCRVVVKEGFSRDLAEKLLDNIKAALAHFAVVSKGGVGEDNTQRESFHH